MTGAILPGLGVLLLWIVAAGVLAPPPSAATEPTVHRVLIESFAFVPERLEIHPGDVVAWVNQDIAPHTATAKSRAWDTGGLTKGRSATIGFPVPGSFPYACDYHPHMRAEIIVLEE